MVNRSIGIVYDSRNHIYNLRIGDRYLKIIPVELEELSKITDGRYFLAKFREWGNPISETLIKNGRTAYDIMKKIQRIDYLQKITKNSSDRLR